MKRALPLVAAIVVLASGARAAHPSEDRSSSEAATASEHPPSQETLSSEPMEDVGPSLDRLLADRRFVFCHEAKRPLRGNEGLCRYARDPGYGCPAFTEACASTAAETPREMRKWQVPSWVGWLSTVLFWLLFGAGVAWWGALIIRHFAFGRLDAPPAQAPVPPRATRREEGPATRVIDKDAVRLLAAAKSALGAGDAAAAMRLAHAALVRALESDGYIRVHASSTNGDYVRSLTPLPILRDLLRATAREVERSEFGSAPPAPDYLMRLLERIEPVVGKIVVMVLVCTAFFASGCALGSAAFGAPDDAPEGTAILSGLLERRHIRFERRTRPVADLLDDEDATTLILSPKGALAAGDAMLLDTWVRSGGTLMVVGGRRDLSEDLGVRRYALDATCNESPRAAEGSALAGLHLIPFGRPLDLAPEWTTEIACRGLPLIATRSYGKGRVVVFADPDFLTNASLARADHARAFFALSGDMDDVSFVDQMLGAGAKSPYRAIANSGLAPLLLHGLAWVALWAVAKGARFGLRRERIEPPRHAFSEHLTAVGRLYARSSSARYALAVYAGWALDRLTMRLLPAGGGGPDELARIVARVTRRPEADVSRILTAATAARDAPQAASAPSDLGVLAALDDIVHETGGHR